jgi:hypothetical protein
MVWHHFQRASDANKQAMARILKEQLDNLQMLYNMMEKELDVQALETGTVAAICDIKE